MVKDFDGEYVVFEDNVFDNNIGMFGGCIHFFESRTTTQTPIIMKNNQYYKNMAYFSGNSVYMRGASNILSQNETFKMNYGMNKGIGGALHIQGNTSDLHE